MRKAVKEDDVASNTLKQSSKERLDFGVKHQDLT